MTPTDFSSPTAQRLDCETRASLRNAESKLLVARAELDAVVNACHTFDREYKVMQRKIDTLITQLDEARDARNEATLRLAEAKDPDLLKRENYAIIAIAEHFGLSPHGTKAVALERILAHITARTETTP